MYNGIKHALSLFSQVTTSVAHVAIGSCRHYGRFVYVFKQHGWARLMLLGIGVCLLKGFEFIVGVLRLHVCLLFWMDVHTAFGGGVGVPHEEHAGKADGEYHEDAKHRAGDDERYFGTHGRHGLYTRGRRRTSGTAARTSPSRGRCGRAAARGARGVASTVDTKEGFQIGGKRVVGSTVVVLVLCQCACGKKT